MSIILEQHKKELLKITEDSPADITLLIDYLEEKLQNKIESYEPKQLEDFKFFVMKSFADEINNSKGDNKYIQELLETLQEIWGDLFEEILQGQPVRLHKLPEREGLDEVSNRTHAPYLVSIR